MLPSLFCFHFSLGSTVMSANIFFLLPSLFCICLCVPGFDVCLFVSLDVCICTSAFSVHCCIVCSLLLLDFVLLCFFCFLCCFVCVLFFCLVLAVCAAFAVLAYGGKSVSVSEADINSLFKSSHLRHDDMRLVYTTCNIETLEKLRHIQKQEHHSYKCSTKYCQKSLHCHRIHPLIQSSSHLSTHLSTAPSHLD